MSKELKKHIQQFEKEIRHAEKSLQTLDNQLTEIKLKKQALRKDIKAIRQQLAILQQAETIIHNNMQTHQSSSSRQPPTLRNIKLKPEMIKLLKENPDKAWTCKEMALTLFERDGQDPNIMPRRFINSIFTAMNRLKVKQLVEKVDEKEKRWKIIQ